MGQNHRLAPSFVLALGFVGKLAGEHVDLALVQAELANVRVQVEHVRALHAGVHDLRRGLVVALGAAHDLAAPLHARNVVGARHIHDAQPVVGGVLVDLVRGPQKSHVLHIHSYRLPDLDEVLAHGLDLVQIAAHLVVQQRKPVRHPKHKHAARTRQTVHVHRLQNALGQVHTTARLEAVVADRTCFRFQELAQLLWLNTLAAIVADSHTALHSLVEVETMIESWEQRSKEHTSKQLVQGPGWWLESSILEAARTTF